LSTTRILLISTTDNTLVAEGLRAGDRELTIVGDVAAAVAAADGHEVVILDLSGEVATMALACRAIRAAAQLTGIPILCVSPTDDIEDRIQLLESGADDVIPRPFHPRELDARAEALALRLQRTRDLTTGADAAKPISDPNQRRVIALYSPKGGVGTTTLAVNIGAWLATELDGDVAILDLDLQFGQVATHLNMTTRMHLGDLARDEAALRDPGLFQSSLDRHASGLMVLAAPPSPEASHGVTYEIVRSVLEIATATFRVVVVDAGSVFDRNTETILSHATDTVIVVTPEFPALKAVHALMEILGARDDAPTETMYVLNEIFSRDLLRPRDIEEALGMPIAHTNPYDAFAFLKSVNEGIPLIMSSPDAAAAGELRRLAARLGGLPDVPAGVTRRPRGLAGLFGRA